MSEKENRDDEGYEMAGEQESRKALRPEGFSLFLLLLPLVLILQAVMGLVIYHSFGSWGDRGTFGDMFGAANTLFSGWAFAGVIVAILMQRRELNYQREELRLTRIELQRSAKAQEDSSRLLGEQVTLMQRTQTMEEERRAAEGAPILMYASGAETEKKKRTIRFSNKGATVRAPKAFPGGGFKIVIEPPEVMPGPGDGVLSIVPGSQKHGPWLFTIKYIDRFGIQRQKAYECSVKGNFLRELGALSVE